MSYRCVTTLTEIQKYLGDTGLVSFDYETSPDEAFRDTPKAALDPHRSHIVGVSFSVAEGEGIYAPLAHRVGKNAETPTKGEPSATVPAFKWQLVQFRALPTLSGNSALVCRCRRMPRTT